MAKPLAFPPQTADFGGQQPKPVLPALTSSQPSGTLPEQDIVSRPLVPVEPPRSRPTTLPEPRPEPPPGAMDPLAAPLEGAPPQLFGTQSVAVVPADKDTPVPPESTVAVKEEPKASTPAPVAAPKLDLPPIAAPKLSLDLGPPIEKAPLPESTHQPAGPADKPAATAPAPALPAPDELAASVERSSDGSAVLVVRADWKKLTRPSLQIALETDAKADLAKLEPIKLDGLQAHDLWQRQVGAINKPIFGNDSQLLKTGVAFLEYGTGRWIRVRSRVNTLGNAAAYAVNDKHGNHLILYLLDGWTDPQGDLRVAVSDLSVAPRFAEPGRLKIWLLGEENVVATGKADWPGKVVAQAAEKPSEKPTPSAAPATAKTEPAKPAPAAVAKPETPPAAPAKPATPPPATVQTPPQAPAKPVETPAKPPATVTAPPREKDIRDMSVDELTSYIEHRYGNQMSHTVRREWLGGMRNYYQVNNPDVVRRDVFMSLLRSCWKDQPSGELRNAFATLYLKLKELQGETPSR